MAGTPAKPLVSNLKLEKARDEVLHLAQLVSDARACGLANVLALREAQYAEAGERLAELLTERLFPTGRG